MFVSVNKYITFVISDTLYIYLYVMKIANELIPDYELIIMVSGWISMLNMLFLHVIYINVISITNPYIYFIYIIICLQP